MNKDSGVSYYRKYAVVVEISFPEGETACKWCRFCRSDSLNRAYCSLVHEYIYNINCPTLPDFCPAVPEEEENE